MHFINEKKKKKNKKKMEFCLWITILALHSRDLWKYFIVLVVRISLCREFVLRFSNPIRY
jgi:hypothetical protein